jgi:prevent-host-death family protein
VHILLNFNIHEAKTNLSSLIQQVEAGEDIVIMRAGKPVARLVQYTDSEPRKLGIFKGKIKIPADFDEPMPDEWFGFEETNKK